jgi:hypothetical protein
VTTRISEVNRFTTSSRKYVNGSNYLPGTGKAVVWLLCFKMIILNHMEMNNKQGINDQGRPADQLRWVEAVSKLLDSQFRLPGTNFRFGLDPILNLIPIAGNLSTFALSGILILTMVRFGASRKVIIMMVGNVVLDTVIGGIPIIGNLFDFVYKANDKNVRLLRRHYHEGKYQGRGTGLLIVIAISLMVLFGLLFWGVWELGEYVYEVVRSYV